MTNDPLGVPATPRPRDANDAERSALPTVGLVTALPEEFVAMRALLDNPREHDVVGDSAFYVHGTLPSSDVERVHHVALSLQRAGMANAAADGCHQLIRSFPSITVVIMVGVAAGVPNPLRPDRHVRLGDIVVASEGIVDYDHIRTPEPEFEQHRVPTPLRALDQALEAMFQDSGRENADLAAIRAASAQRRDRPNQVPPASHAPASTCSRALAPSSQLIHCVDLLKANDSAGVRPWERWLRPSQVPELAGYDRPPDHTDILHDRVGRRLRHPRRDLSGHRKGFPKVHYGLLATSTTSLGDTSMRAELANRHGILAVEMEGAGISSVLPGREWLAVRGISDYGGNHDKYTSNQWLRYASLAAAAYVRALLATCIPAETSGRQTSPHSDAAVWPT